MIALLFAWAGLAAPGAVPADGLDRYPLRAEVTLAAEGVTRIVVPPALRSPEDPPDGSDLLLVNGAGEAVPVAVARGEPAGTEVDPWVRATLEPDTYAVDVGALPVDALVVTVPEPRLAAEVTVFGPDGPVAAPTLVWSLPGDAQTRVPIRPTAGDLTVKLRWIGGRSGGAPEIDALRWPYPPVPEDVIVVPVDGGRLSEDGTTRYPVTLDRPLPIARLSIRARDDVFERSADVRTYDGEHVTGGTISRVRVGGASLDQTALPIRRALERFVVAIDRPGLAPLDVTDVAVHLEGVALYVRDPGPGPWTLYAGAPPSTSPSWDIAGAAPELARLAVAEVTPAAATANPAYVPPEVRGGLDRAGPPVELRRMRWQAPIDGPPGLVRAELPTAMLATARYSLADARLIDAEGRQVPFLLRRVPADRPLGALPFTREERGGTSWLSVPLPVANVPVSTVTLTTDAPRFHRTVTIARSAGAHLDSLRAIPWHGDDRPGKVAVDVDAVVGDVLWVGIDNGDNPPLAVTAVEVTVPAWELVARLPEAPVRLVWGDPRLDAPAYDFALVGDDVTWRARAVATVGEPAPLAPPGLSGGDKALLAVGIAVLALGLLGLVVRLVRGLPDGEVAGAT